MNGFKKVWYGVDNVLFKIVRLLIFATMTAMVLVATAQVLMRYFLSMPMRWSNEFCCFMLVYSVFLGAALGLRNAEHVQLDITKFPFPPAMLKVMNLLSTIAVYVFLGIYLYYGTRFAFKNLNSVTEVMKWPYITLYIILPISGILMLIGETTAVLHRTDKKEETK